MAHVSYSEIKLWHECPRKHKLQYIDKLDGFKGNLHTAFGTAMHSVCEHGLLDESLDRGKHFLEEFAKEVASLKEKEVQIEPKLYEQMSKVKNPFGDGNSGELIVKKLIEESNNA